MAIIGKEQDSVTSDMDVWKDPTEAENFELSDSQRFILPKEVSLPSTPPPWNVAFFISEEINLSFSAKATETFSEGNSRHDNTDVAQNPPIVASRLITGLKIKQAPRGEVEKKCNQWEGMVSTKELNELANSFKQKSEEYVQDQVEFIDVGPLNGDSRFNMETNTGKQCKT